MCDTGGHTCTGMYDQRMDIMQDTCGPAWSLWIHIVMSGQKTRDSFRGKTATLTVLQGCVVANVALVNLVFGCHGRKVNVPNVQDGSKYTVHTSKLLKHTEKRHIILP